MAIFHMSAQMITRSKGHSSVAAAAYRHGEKMTDEFTGEVHDYTKKKGVDDSVILIPDHANRNFLKPEFLYNFIEKSERRKDAGLSRELNISLPIEMSNEQKKALAIEFCNEQFVKNGMIADIAFHKLDSENPHFHVMLTTRNLSQDGQNFGEKNREWNSKEKVQEWRKAWSDTANEHLQAANVNARIDHRSLVEQKAELDALPSPSLQQQARAIGLDRQPTIHVNRHKKPGFERLQLFEERQKVKVSQEEKATAHIEKHSPAPGLDAGGEKGDVNKFLSKLNIVSDYIDKKLEKTETASTKDLAKENKSNNKQSTNSKNSSAAVSSNIKLTDETTDKNLRLTEAQREELEELEQKEEAVKRKAYSIDSSPDFDHADNKNDNEYKSQSTSTFLNKFRAVKKSFTEQRFIEEKEAYENRKNKNKYTPK